MKKLALVAAVLMMVATTGPVAAAGPQVTADLEGRPIQTDRIPDYFCHDRDFPQIHCYRTASRLDAALASGATGPLALTGSSDYVVVFSSPSYAGSYFYVSHNYDVLAIVGWNDRIRSYRGLNGASGSFWTDWFESGAGQLFCCNQTVPVLSPTFDSQISSVYRS
ncbi:MAG: hypothetical protein ACYDAN_00910 [Candidatus Limnocylindrales bacterium]